MLNEKFTTMDGEELDIYVCLAEDVINAGIRKIMPGANKKTSGQILAVNTPVLVYYNGHGVIVDMDNSLADDLECIFGDVLNYDDLDELEDLIYELE